eukprot:Protomagalhaensia_wolfi_Nauph_80__292@NODE_1162_length_1688_cov_71_639782_g886_i0_p1_GENE_NODE_1162_length_1688_cov_71_639782_g886_i0NODE_1162_length_1688_cov_71_639782_g886_i0_p1_ORF_typecomplete_len299_score32_01Nbs1_C/PF08599_10/0_41_NODE_1162_length_1688_cov_71_639782_g886_i07201616
MGASAPWCRWLLCDMFPFDLCRMYSRDPYPEAPEGTQRLASEPVAGRFSLAMSPVSSVGAQSAPYRQARLEHARSPERRSLAAVSESFASNTPTEKPALRAAPKLPIAESEGEEASSEATHSTPYAAGAPGKPFSETKMLSSPSTQSFGNKSFGSPFASKASTSYSPAAQRRTPGKSSQPSLEVFHCPSPVPTMSRAGSVSSGAIASRLLHIETVLADLLQVSRTSASEKSALEEWARRQIRKENLDYRRETLLEDLEGCANEKAAKQTLIAFLESSVDKAEYNIAVDAASVCFKQWK